MKVEFREATYEDAVEFYNGRPIRSFRGFFTVWDGEIVGCHGVFFNNTNMIAFLEIKESARNKEGVNKVIMKGYRHMEKFLDSLNYPVVAFAHKEEPTAEGLLLKLGFEHTGQMTPEGEAMVRRKD